MVKTLQLKLVLLLCMIMGAGTAWADTTYKLTKVTSVEAGGLYVFEQDGYVMNNTVSSSALQTTNTYSTKGLSGTETYVWKLETASNGFYMRNISLSAAQYLYNASSTGVSLSNNKSVWTFSFTNEVAVIQNYNNSNRFLGYTNATSHAYKAYATSNLTSTTYPHDITVYKLEEETGGTPSCAMPAFSPAAGTYTSAQSVTISSETSGATIYYTTDGNDPTTSSAVYSAAIPVNSTTTIKAMAVKDNYDNSSVATAIYTIVNIEHAGTEADPYTVADARNAIDANTGLADVYATGIVSAIPTAWSTDYNNITFNIVDNSGDTNFLQAFRCVSGTGVDASKVAVGDIVVVKGTLTKYGSTYEFGQGCELVSLTSTAAVEAPTFSPVAGTYADAQNVTLSCETSGATIYYTTDGTEPNSQSTAYTNSAINVSTTTTIKAIAIKGSDQSSVATATYHINSQTNPYTVTQALAFADYQYPANGIYVSGIVSTAPTQAPTSDGQLTYYISADGTTTDQLEVYKGKGLNQAAFTAQDDIQVGDEVTVYGNVVIFGTTNPIKEFATGNYLVAFNRPQSTEPAITATPTSLTGFTYEVGNGPSAAQQITIGGSNLTNSWSASLDANSDFEFSFSETDGYFSDSSIGANPSDPNQSVVLYVRLKSGLAVGDYNGAITITSQGAETVTVNLSGSVNAAAAANVTWDLSIASYDEVTDPDIVTWSSAYATMINSSKNGGTSASNYLGGDSNNRTSSRFYSGNTLTITPAAGYSITSIEFVATSTGYADALGGSNWTNASASVNGTTVTVTPTNGANAVSAAITGTCGFTSVKVYYEAAAPSAPVWATLPAPEITLGEDYELNLAGYVSGYPKPTITLTSTSADANDYEYNSDNLYFLPSAAGLYDFTFKAENSEGSVEETLSILVNAPAATIEVSETAINVPSNEVSTSYVEIPVTYNNFTNPAGNVQFFDANDNPLTSNPNSSWITVAILNNNVAYKILAENTDSEPRTAYCKVVANDDTGSPVYSDLITITQAGYVAPSTGRLYELFNGNLEEGDYIIYYDGKAMKNTVSSGRLEYEEVTPVGNIITTDDATIVWHIAPSGSYWTIYSADADAYAAGTGVKNKAQMLDDETDDKALWTVTEENGTYEFVNKANADAGVNANLRNNDTYGFACYANTTGGALSLYKLQTVTITIKAGRQYTGFSCDKALDFEGTGLTAQIVTSATGASSTVTKVPANTGVIVGLDAVTTTQQEIAVPVYTGTATDDVTGNMLVAVLTATTIQQTANGNTNYVFGKAYGKEQFFKVNYNGMEVPANNVYLAVPSNAAKDLDVIGFGGDATSINALETETVNGNIYNLQGQKVNRAQKGIYIVNGRKVVIK